MHRMALSSLQVSERPRSRRRRRGRAVLRLLLRLVILAIVLALGVALGDALGDRPGEPTTATVPRDVSVVTVTAVRQTVTVVVTATP